MASSEQAASSRCPDGQQLHQLEQLLVENLTHPLDIVRGAVAACMEGEEGEETTTTTTEEASGGQGGVAAAALRRCVLLVLYVSRGPRCDGSHSAAELGVLLRLVMLPSSPSPSSSSSTSPANPPPSHAFRAALGAVEDQQRLLSLLDGLRLRVWSFPPFYEKLRLVAREWDQSNKAWRFAAVRPSRAVLDGVRTVFALKEKAATDAFPPLRARLDLRLTPWTEGCGFGLASLVPIPEKRIVGVYSGVPTFFVDAFLRQAARGSDRHVEYTFPLEQPQQQQQQQQAGGVGVGGGGEGDVLFFIDPTDPATGLPPLPRDPDYERFSFCRVNEPNPGEVANLAFERAEPDQETRFPGVIFVVARRPVAAGETLLASYGRAYSRPWRKQHERQRERPASHPLPLPPPRQKTVVSGNETATPTPTAADQRGETKTTIDTTTTAIDGGGCGDEGRTRPMLLSPDCGESGDSDSSRRSTSSTGKSDGGDSSDSISSSGDSGDSDHVEVSKKKKRVRRNAGTAGKTNGNQEKRVRFEDDVPTATTVAARRRRPPPAANNKKRKRQRGRGGRGKEEKEDSEEAVAAEEEDPKQARRVVRDCIRWAREEWDRWPPIICVEKFRRDNTAGGAGGGKQQRSSSSQQQQQLLMDLDYPKVRDVVCNLHRKWSDAQIKKIVDRQPDQHFHLTYTPVGGRGLPSENVVCCVRGRSQGVFALMHLWRVGGMNWRFKDTALWIRETLRDHGDSSEEEENDDGTPPPPPTAAADCWSSDEDDIRSVSTCVSSDDEVTRSRKLAVHRRSAEMLRRLVHLSGLKLAEMDKDGRGCLCAAAAASSPANDE